MTPQEIKARKAIKVKHNDKSVKTKDFVLKPNEYLKRVKQIISNI